MRSAAQRVGNGAIEISSASADLADRTERQAANLQETSTAMRQLTLSANTTAQTAAEASTAQLSVMIDKISDASRNQSETIMQVDAAVATMGRSTTQNAAMVEEASAAARSLSTDAGAMTTLVNRFDTGQKHETRLARAA